MKFLTRKTICLLTDWLEADWLEYRSQGSWWHRHVGEWAQIAWFKAHNNRLYIWAATEDE